MPDNIIEFEDEPIESGLEIKKKKKALMLMMFFALQKVFL